MVYAILKSLSGLELIDGEWDNSTYPPRAVYAATTEGDARFQRWLRQPVGRLREVRLDFMVKLYFLLEEELDEERLEARGLIEDQLGVCETYAAGIEREMADVADGSFDELALASKLSAARMTSVWLVDCLQRIGASGQDN
jgi:hypothetical protein